MDRSGATGESTPLMSSNTSDNNGGGGGQQYYFLAKSGSDYQSNAISSVQDADGGETIEEIPQGSHTDEFAPKPLMPIEGTPASRRQKTVPPPANNGGFLSNLFQGRNGGRPSGRPSTRIGEIGTMVKPRKAPIKVEPKVFFANERTFLAWMHLSVTLAGASIAILAFAEDQNPFSQLYGVLLLPVAIAFIIYSMYQYSRRATMIRHRNPGPYEDTVGPAVLGIMLMISIVAQFSLKLYALAS